MLNRAHFYVIFGFWVQLCLVHYLFIISTSAVDCLGKFVSVIYYYESSGTLTNSDDYLDDKSED